MDQLTGLPLYHICFEFWGSIFCFLAGIAVYASRGIDKKRANLLIGVLVSSALVGIADAVAWIFDGNPLKTAFFAVRISTFLLFLFQNILIQYGTAYYRYLMITAKTSGEERKKIMKTWNGLMSFVGLCCSITVILVIVSQFFPILYAFDDNNSYYRLPLSVIQQILPAVSMFVLLLFAFRDRKHLCKEDFSCLILCIALSVISAVSMAFHYGISMSVFVSDICALFMFVSYEIFGGHVAARREVEIAERDADIAHQKIRIMQNQIRPHFIFNSLLAIKQLCVEDPNTAADALQHFASYLRVNLEAMTDERLVPFERELDCIREYVALEQADPANEFQVVYDLSFVDFEIPLLTVEPMVENAIRHGLASRKKDGIVRIKTYQENGMATILVEDNGSGYGSETRQQAEHRSVGIANVKERLKMQCGGDLSIINTGRGTIVKIDIPLPGTRPE